MSFSIVHLNGAKSVLQSKHLLHDINVTMAFIDETLTGAANHGELLRQALTQTEWRNESVDLKILEGRRYSYKGWKNRVAIDGNFTVYEYLQTALFRLQLGYDQGLLDAGIVLLNSARSEKSLIGTSRELAIREVELLSPTISLPVSIALFDLSVTHIQAMEEYKNAA